MSQMSMHKLIPESGPNPEIMSIISDATAQWSEPGSSGNSGNGQNPPPPVAARGKSNNSNRAASGSPPQPPLQPLPVISNRNHQHPSHTTHATTAATSFSSSSSSSATTTATATSSTTGISLLPQKESQKELLPPWQSQDLRSTRRLNELNLRSPSPLHNRHAPTDSPLPQPGHHHHHHQYLSSPPNSPQEQLERLAAEACSVVGDITGNPERCESACSSRSSASASSHIYASNRDRPQQQRLDSVPETKPLSSTVATAATASTSNPTSPMASAATNSNRVMPRSSSIDSALSSATAAPGSSNNALAQITGTSTADIQSLIQAAGSAEEAIRFMLKEKQSMAAQNSQLWRLVDKQRAMILGLNKDLERALKEKDRYRKKLKEQMGMVPPLPTNSAASRATSESPAPSLDEAYSRSESASPPRGEGITRSESLASSVGGGRDELLSSMEIAIAPYPITPSPTHPQQVLGNARERMPSPTEHNAPTFRDPRELASGIHDDDDDRVASPTPLSPKTKRPASRPTELSDDAPRWYNSSEPMTHAKKVGLGLATNVPPAAGLGKSPVRKAPPKPLELPHSQLQHQIQQGDDDDLTTTHATCDSDDSWQVTPEDKKGHSVNSPPRWMGNGPLTAPPTRSPPAPYIQSVPLTPGPNNVNHRLSPDTEGARIRAQWANARGPLPSPGLPVSPRPMDRPPNSPLPRASRNFSLDSSLGVPGSAKPVFQSLTIPATPRSSMPVSSPRITTFGHERSGSEGSALSPLSRQNSPAIELMIPTSMITSASVSCRVVSSRMKPSRASMIPGKALATAESVFTLGLFSNADEKEILRVEKDVAALPALDSKLRKYITYHVAVPDRELFSGHAPARVDARRVALDEYFGAIFSATMNEPAALALCEFFSTDVVESPPTSSLERTKESPVSFDKIPGSIAVKEGYLTKKGKNFGGWKERYFALEGSTLKYFDGPGGTQLGQIKLHNAQIGRQSSKAKDDGTVDEDNQYRHAFLVLEPKRKDSSTMVRHVLCAESDKERDEWVSVLLEHVTTDKEDEGKTKLKHSKSKDGKEVKDGKDGSEDGKNGDNSSLRSMSYDEASQGPAPARGPTPEELSRQQISPSPNSMLSQPSPFPSAAPALEKNNHPTKQISGPSNGSVISDLAAWGASKLSKEHEDKKAEKALKKRSIWGFKQKIVSDVDDQKSSHATNGYQQAAERFPLARAVFGASLEEAVYLTKPPGVDVALPSVVYRCIEYLDAKNASNEEGIFRLSGSNVVIKGLKERFNSESDVNLLANDEYYDVHAISGLLKLYLRELPASILTSERRDDFVKITEIEDKNEKITALNKLVHSLPEANFALLKALSGHLLRIVDNSDVNKMTIRNVGIVFSPTLNIPAQVFSMFLHEYRYIFFRDADGNPPALAPPTAASPQPPRSPMPPMMSPRTQNFDFPERRMMEPPRTPMLPSHPAAIRPPGMAQQTVAYEPNYENQPHISSPTQISGPRFDNIPPPSDDSSSGNSLAVPGADAKSNKSRRRESSMMFMMGGLKKSPFQKSPNVAMVEEDLYG